MIMAEFLSYLQFVHQLCFIGGIEELICVCFSFKNRQKGKGAKMKVGDSKVGMYNEKQPIISAIYICQG